MIVLEGLSVLTDFDGTITKRDVGSSIIDVFGGPECKEVEEEWKRGLIGSAESHRRQYSTIKAQEEDLKSHILEMELEDGFLSFFSYLKRKGIPLKIISDGFDFYLELLLKKYHLEVEYRCNRLNLETMEFVFPNQHESCWRCAHCKVKSLQDHLKREKRVIYIGDGLSDLYGAVLADIIFAKRGKNLAEALEERGVSDFILFDTFNDIVEVLEEFSLTYRFQEITHRECWFEERREQE